MPAPAPRARRSGDLRRREIAEAALRLIASQGLRRFTSAALADEVGVTDGALFRHFASKEAIVLAAIDRVEELLFEGFPPRDEEPIARLGAFFLRRVEVIRERPGISRLVISDELSHAAPPEGVARVAELKRRSLAFVRACLVEAERQGALAPGLRAGDAAVVVLGAILALGHGAATSVGAAPVDRAAARRVWGALEIFLRGATPPRAEDAGRRPPRAPGRSPRRRSS
jgi:AcrR family transcriptional regulator